MMIYHRPKYYQYVCLIHLIYRVDILRISSFFRYEIQPLVEAPDDHNFFLPLFFRGIDDVKVSLNVKAIHHVSNERKEFWKNQSGKVTEMTKYNVLREKKELEEAKGRKGLIRRRQIQSFAENLR